MSRPALRPGPGRPIVVAVLLAVLALVAACAPSPGGSDGSDGSDGGDGPGGLDLGPLAEDSVPASSVRIDTPRLRELKADAGIADCPTSDASADSVPGGLPAVTLPCLGGGRDVTLSGLAGRPMVINIWASWCGPCRDELPLLHRFAERAGDRVAMLGIDFNDTRPEAALLLAKQSGVRYPLVADLDTRVEQPFRVIGLPMTVLVDPDGEVVHTIAGEIHSVDQLQSAVHEHLGVDVSGGSDAGGQGSSGAGSDGQDGGDG